MRLTQPHPSRVNQSKIGGISNYQKTVILWWLKKDGKKEGLREYFDEEGNLTKTEEWKDGVLHE